MANADIAEMEEVIRRRTAESFFSEIGGARFITAQIFTILATVIGVYLAGYVSFQRTLKYDRIIKAQQRLELLTATREELKQNIDRLRKFNDRLPADVGTGVQSTEWPRLRLFVWQASGRSPALFDVPSKIVTDLQALYEDLGDMLNDGEAHQSFRSLTTSNAYFRTQFKERLNSQLATAGAALLPALEQAAAPDEALLAQYSDSGPGPGEQR